MGCKIKIIFLSLIVGNHLFFLFQNKSPVFFTETTSDDEEKPGNVKGFFLLIYDRYYSLCINIVTILCNVC